MKNNRVETMQFLLIGVILLLMITNLALFIRMNQLQSLVVNVLQPFQRPMGLVSGNQAPPFILKDPQGKTVSLDEFTGKTLLLIFSSTTCQACEEMYPVLQRFHETYPGLPLIMISRGSEEDNRALVQQQGFDFTVLTWEDAVAKQYLIPGTPYFYWINPEGKIAGQGVAASFEQIEGYAKESFTTK